MAENETRNRRKVRVGVVISDSRDKTVTVEVPTSSAHPRYDKVVSVAVPSSMPTTRPTTPNVGDTVRIMETRPISKQKRWRVVEIVERAR